MVAANARRSDIDPFGLANQCRKPIVTAVTGIVFTVGIEMMLAGDIVVAADNCRFCQMEARRGIAPIRGAPASDELIAKVVTAINENYKAAASQTNMLIAGIAGLVAGAMSMVAGEYVSVS